MLLRALQKCTFWLIFVVDGGYMVGDNNCLFVHTDNRSVQDICTGKWLPFHVLLNVSSLWPGHKV